jgi:hypothetical protein
MEQREELLVQELEGRVWSHLKLRADATSTDPSAAAAVTSVVTAKDTRTPLDLIEEKRRLEETRRWRGQQNQAVELVEKRVAELLDHASGVRRDLDNVKTDAQQSAAASISSLHGSASNITTIAYAVSMHHPMLRVRPTTSLP